MLMPNLAAAIPFFLSDVLFISKRFQRLSKETRFPFIDLSVSRRRPAFLSAIISAPRRRLAFLSAVYQSLEGDLAFLSENGLTTVLPSTPNCYEVVQLPVDP